MVDNGADVLELVDTDKIAQRAWLLGKLQTSLMRDGWGVINIDAPAGSLTVVDGPYQFTLSATLPENNIPPVEVLRPTPAKKTGSKRKR